MNQVAHAMPDLSVVRGLTYSDRSQLLNRRLVPSYRNFFRWLGSAPDAEDATCWLFDATVSSLRLPAPVEKVNGRLHRATIQALGLHWAAGYGVSATSWAAIAARAPLAGGAAEVSLRTLLDPLPAELRLLVALRIVRRLPIEAVARRLRLSPAGAKLLLFEGLTGIGVSIGLPDASATIVQAGLVARFVDDLSGGRRTARFECAPTTLTALLAAAHVQAAIPGNDLPSPRFVRRMAAAFG